MNSALQHFLDKNGGIFTSQEAVEAGFQRSTLKYLVDRKELDQPMRGLYSDPNQLEDPFVLWQKKYKQGIFGGETGLYLYQLTTKTPFSYHMYFKQGFHFNRINNEVIPHYVKANKFEENIEVVKTPSLNNVRCYSVERCLVDFWSENPSSEIAYETLQGYYQTKFDPYLLSQQLSSAKSKGVQSLKTALEALQTQW